MFITQLKLACVGLVAECNLSFNIIRSEAFRELLELSAGRTVKIPSTRDTMKCLSELFEFFVFFFTEIKKDELNQSGNWDDGDSLGMDCAEVSVLEGEK